MNEDDNPTPFKRAKRRLQNACDECRKRKVKCNSAEMPDNNCSNCLGSGIPCTHSFAMEKKRQTLPARPPNSLADAQQLVNSILSTSKPFIVPRDTQTVHQLLVDLAHYARSLERRASPSASSSPEHTSDPADPFCLGHEPPTPAGFYIHTEMSPAEEVDLNNIKDIFGLLTLEETAPRHFGPSSTVKFIHSVLFLKQRIKGTKERVSRKRPQFWSIYPWQAERVEPPPEYIFPSNALMHELVDIFFEKINAYLPLLHRPTFEKCIADDLHRQNSQFGATVLAVCACAARYSNNPQVLADPTEELSAGWHYFRQVRLLRPSFVSLATVYELQLYCLACIFLYSTTTPEACWTLLGHAVRCAQDMGIHRSPPKHAKPTVESQLLNRAFWCLFVIDVVMTGAVGRPRAIHPDEYDVPLPIDCDDEYWETANPEDAFKQPPGKPSSISFWISFIKLFDILAFSQLKMCIVRKSDTDSEWTERNVMEIDSRLNAWVDTIPEHLKWDPNRVNNLFFHQSAILNMTYYWVQMQVHRPFIILIQKEIVSPLPSQAICANAARSCCHIMAAQHRRDVISHPVTLHAGHLSAVILFLHVWRCNENKPPPDSEKALRDCYECFECLGMYERRFQIAGYFRDLLAEMFRDMPSYRQSLKRPREGDNNSRRPSDSGGTSVLQPAPAPPPMASSSSAFVPDIGHINDPSLYLPMYSEELGNQTPTGDYHTSYLTNGPVSSDWASFNTLNPNFAAEDQPTVGAQESAFMNHYADEYLSLLYGSSDSWLASNTGSHQFNSEQLPWTASDTFQFTQ